MGSASFKKYAILAALVAVVGGVLHALPYMGTSVSQRALLAAARGMTAFHNVKGFTTEWTDGIAARLWRMGGAPAVAWGEIAAVAAWWTVVGFVILLAVAFGLRWVKKPRTRGVAFAVAAVVLLGTSASAVWRRAMIKEASVEEIRLLAAAELGDQVKGTPRAALFSNTFATIQLLLFAPESAGGLTPQQSSILAMNPPAWRTALRATNWSKVVLAGPIGEYRPLLEHLLTSPDWRLASVTNLGYLFLRESGAPVSSIDPETFRLGSDRETAIYLAQISERYDAIRRTADARACIERALELAPDDVTVLSHAATFAAGRKHWQDAITYSGRALAKGPSANHPKLVRALALLETGEALKAQNLCDEILAEAPNDLYTLFLYARICRAINDYNLEAETLEKIIALSERAGLSTLSYRIYLGQAYARLGQPEPALKNYRIVLDSGTLNKEQADEVRDAISTIEQNAPKE